MKQLLQIRCVGKPQEPWQHQAINMYLTRCAPFGGVQVIELPEGQSKVAEQDADRVKDAEAQGLLKNIPDHALTIALDTTGKLVSTEELAQTIRQATDQARPLVFLIGGSWGLGTNALKHTDQTLSLGRITLPHVLARIVLMEQIYRSLMINAGRKYHK